MQACRPETRVGFFGCCWFCRRRGEQSVAPRAERDLLAGSWVSGDGVRRPELDSGALWWKLWIGLVFGQKLEQVFVVDGRSCGESWAEGLGGLGRWCSGGLDAGFWEGLGLNGGGNFKGGGVRLLW